MLRQLEFEDMDVAAQVLRTTFDHALPSLAGLHTPQEDRWFFRERVFTTCQVWGAFDGAAMIGVIAFREGWIDHLYVLHRRKGAASAASYCTSPRTLFPGCSCGPSSATPRRDGFTKPEALPRSGKPTAPPMRRRNRMPSTSGPAARVD